MKQARQRKTNIISYYLCVESKKKDTKKCMYKTETDSGLENKFMVTEGERRSGEELGVLVKVLEKLGDYLFYVHTTTYK